MPLIAPNGTVTDVDAAPSDLLLATLSVAHGTLTPIGSVAGLTIVNGQDGSNGTLSFTGTQAAITQAIDTGVTYAPSLNYNGSDTLTFTVNDQGHTGSGGPQTATATVGIVVSSDQAPTLGNAGNTIGYTELQVVPPAIDAVLTVADVDNANLASATVSIASGFFAGDALNFTNQNGITGSYNGATGVLTLTGTATVAQYQAALESVTFSSSSANPTHFGTDSGRSISWVVNDGTLNSAAQTTTVNITAVDNAPVIANVSGTVSTNQNTPVPLIAPNGTVTDVDAAPSDLLLATLSVAHGTLTPIGSVAGLTIVNGQDGSNGTLSFTGTQAAITQAIDTGVTYAPSLNYNGSDTLTFTVNDQGHTGSGGPQTATATVGIVVSSDQAPTLGNAGNTIGYTELQVVPPAIDAVLTVADVDNANLASATVSIASGFFAGDALNFTNQNGITGSYNGATGVLTLTGTATVAQYQAALELVTFSSSSANPTHFGTDSGRSISWVVNDGTLNSAAQTTTVNITAVDNAPVIANVSGTVSTNQNTPVPLIAPNGTVTDVDAAPSDLLLATLSVAHGTLTPIGSVAGLTIVNGQDGSNGTLSFTGTQAAITQAIDTGVTYAPSLNYNGSDTLTFTVNDQGHTGSGGPQTATATVGIVVSSTATTEPFTWIAASDGDWSDPSNWNNNSVPGASDQTVIQVTGESFYTVTISSDQTVDSLNAIGSAHFDITTGALIISGSGSSHVAGAVDNSGVLNVQNGALALDGLITNSALLEATDGGTLEINNDVANTSGTIAASGINSTISLSGGTVTDGTLTIGITDTLSIESTSGATLDNVDLENSGNIQVDAQNTTVDLVLADGTILNGGTLSIGSSGEVEIKSGANGSGATLNGTTVTISGASVPTGSLALDGNGFSNTAAPTISTSSVTLTTANANDVIILDIVQNGTTVNTVSDTAGLVWHQRAVAGTPPFLIYEYYAIAPTALSADAITVNFAGTPGYVDLNTFGVSGANTLAPFDTNVSLPATPAVSTGSVTTSNANDFIFAGYRSNDASSDAGSGWTAINTNPDTIWRSIRLYRRHRPGWWRQRLRQIRPAASSMPSCRLRRRP